MLVAVTRAFVVTPLLSGAGRRSPVHVCCTTDEPAAPLPPDSFDSAEARGIELYQRGEHERAIRMFELAQTLPGAGIDYKREKQGGMIGSAFAPPNPREWAENRFATPEQKLIAQYNSKHHATTPRACAVTVAFVSRAPPAVACCYAAMGDSPRAVELLKVYISKVDNPLNQVNEMLVDSDLASIRDSLREMRQELKGAAAKPGLFGLSFKNPIKEAAESIGVEWKD